MRKHHFRNVSAERFVKGESNIGLPYIFIDTDLDLEEVLARANQEYLPDQEMQVFYTLFHEYVHVLQMLVSPICQLIALECLQELYCLNQTAIKRKTQKEIRVGDIESDPEGRHVSERLEAALTDRKSINYIWDVSTGDIIEGVARMLEEAFRGEVVEEAESEYTRAWKAVNSGSSNIRINKSQFLDLCELALRTEHPAEAFEIMYKALREKGDIPSADFFMHMSELMPCLGLQQLRDVSECIVKSNANVLPGDVFKAYREQVKGMVDAIHGVFGEGPVFSKLYIELEECSAKGLPITILNLISKSGSPIIYNKSGQTVQWDVTGSNELQCTAMGVYAVYSLFFEQQKNPEKCKLISWCSNAVQCGKCNILLDASCERAPWDKTRSNAGLCPFQVVWKSLGLDGLRP